MDNQRVSLPSKQDLLKAKVRLDITRLFKGFLFTVEEVVSDHDMAVKKLHAELPTELKSYANLISYISDERLDSMRKKILDSGNATIRDIEEQIDNLRLDEKK